MSERKDICYNTASSAKSGGGTTFDWRPDEGFQTACLVVTMHVEVEQTLADNLRSQIKEHIPGISFERCGIGVTSITRQICESSEFLLENMSVRVAKEWANSKQVSKQLHGGRCSLLMDSSGWEIKDDLDNFSNMAIAVQTRILLYHSSSKYHVEAYSFFAARYGIDVKISSEFLVENIVVCAAKGLVCSKRMSKQTHGYIYSFLMDSSGWEVKDDSFDNLRNIAIVAQTLLRILLYYGSSEYQMEAYSFFVVRCGIGVNISV
jgi:hypothetical protein